MQYRRKHATFWGCANFPSCRATVPYHRWVLRIAQPQEELTAWAALTPASVSALPPPPPPPPPPAATSQELWTVVPYPPPLRMEPVTESPGPTGFKHGVGMVLIGLGWLAVAGFLLALVGSPTVARNQQGFSAVSLVLIGAPTLWGSLRLFRARRLRSG
jgi:hypothetical protein